MASRERLRRLHDATAEMTRSLDVGHRIRTAVRAARSLESAEAASLMLRDKTSDALVISAQEGLSETYAARQRIPMDRARAAYRGPDEHIVLDLRAGPLGDAALIRAEGLAKALAVPLVHEGELIGALTIYTKDPERSFDEDDIEVAHILAAQAAIGITNARLFADALAQRELQRHVLDSLGEGVIIAWPDGRYEANASAKTILGIGTMPSLAELRDAVDVRDLRTGESVPAGSYPLDRALRGESSSGEFFVTQKSTGQRRDLAVNAAPVHGTDGGVIGAVMTLHDVTDLHAAEREREEFLSIVSHELRTPLTPLKALAQLVRSRMRRAREQGSELDLDSLDRNLAAIERQVDRMNGLVNDLLSVSRAEKGSLSMERVSYDLAVLVREVVERYVDATLEEGRHVFAVEAPESVPAHGDQSRVEQLLVNLVGNAVKYSPTGGPIRVRLVTQGRTAEILITDSGVGIPPDEIAKLGDPFVRGAGRANSFAGMGVGPYVARTLSGAHGGSLDL